MDSQVPGIDSAENIRRHIELIPTTHSDIPFVLEQERSPDTAPYVRVWTPAEHLHAVAAAGIRHLIVRVDGQRGGFAILADTLNPDRSVELRRLVIVRKDDGHGRAALRLLMRMAFEDLHAHRLWLDVKTHNARAIHLYESEGFVSEGILRECINTGGGFDSLMVLSMLAAEYRRIQRRLAP